MKKIITIMIMLLLIIITMIQANEVDSVSEVDNIVEDDISVFIDGYEIEVCLQGNGIFAKETYLNNVFTLIAYDYTELIDTATIVEWFEFYSFYGYHLQCDYDSQISLKNYLNIKGGI